LRFRESDYFSIYVVVVVVDLEMKKFGFFSSIDWENIHQVVPPFVPCPEGDTDTSYFDGECVS